MDFALSRMLGARSRKAVLAVMAGAALATAAPPSAMAQGGWNPGAAAAFGVVGGLALGAALANRDGYGEPAYYAPGYYGHWHHHPRYVYAEPLPDNCYVVRERIWVHGWGWDVRPRTICE